MRPSAVLMSLWLLALPSGGPSAAQTPSGGQARAYRLAEAPEALRPAVQKATQAFEQFQTRLEGRVADELTRGGPLSALSVYRDEAAALTANLGRQHGMRIGRTSHRLRNPQNAPPAWAAPYVTAAAAQGARNAPTWVIPIGEAVGVVAPLETKQVCTLCHARAEELPPALAGAIRKSYPGDQATGFSAGQVRGWMWAEVPRR